MDHTAKGQELVEYLHRVGDERGTTAIIAALAEAEHQGFQEGRQRALAASEPGD